MRGSGQDVVLITRLSSEKAEQIKAVHLLAYHAEAGIGVIGELPAPDGIGRIVVATGGTSDIPGGRGGLPDRRGSWQSRHPPV